MTDEVGEHMRISMTVWMTGALLAVVVGVAAFSLLVFNNYTTKYSEAMVGATTSPIYALAAEPSVTCPACYSAIDSSISEVEKVLVKFKGQGAYSVYYDYRNVDNRLLELMTGANSTKNMRLSVQPSTSNTGLVVVTLEEVTR